MSGGRGIAGNGRKKIGGGNPLAQKLGSDTLYENSAATTISSSSPAHTSSKAPSFSTSSSSSSSRARPGSHVVVPPSFTLENNDSPPQPPPSGGRGNPNTNCWFANGETQKKQEEKRKAQTKLDHQAAKDKTNALPPILRKSAGMCFIFGLLVHRALEEKYKNKQWSDLCV